MSGPGDREGPAVAPGTTGPGPDDPALTPPGGTAAVTQPGPQPQPQPQPEARPELERDALEQGPAPVTEAAAGEGVAGPLPPERAPGPGAEQEPASVPRGHPGARRARQRRRRLIAVLGVVLLLVVGVVAWYEVEANPLGGPGAAVIITVRPGEAADTVLADLARHGVIGSSLAFRLGDLVLGAPAMQPGRYLLHQNQSFGAVRARLDAGPNVFAVSVTPGMTLREVAARVDGLPGYTGAGFLKAATAGTVRSAFGASGGTSLEGLLGTGTYQILPGESDTTLLGQMVARFDRQASSAGLTQASAQALGLTAAQVVTVASVVEKEGWYEKNLGPVARVIYNRLARGMKLQMDTTVLYALGRDGGTVTAADLKVASPYNTYLHAGLPPGPIGVPSVAAMRAAVSPPAGGWLYFVVVQKDGTEAFSDTYAGQLANEAVARSRGVIP